MNPSMMPRKIVADTVRVPVKHVCDIVGGCEDCWGETIPVQRFGVARPTVLEVRAERKHQKFVAELDARDGLVPSITREAAWKRARRAAGLK